jgi:hypothetical protein
VTRSTLTRFVLPVATVLLAHAALRMAYPDSVEPDDADLVIFSQHVAWGYSDQAPLYSWLCEVAFAVFGVGVVAITVVRTAILAVALWWLDAAARLVCPDRRTALLATYSVLLIPSLSWHALAYLTHTNLALALCGGTLYAFLRILRDGRTLDYLLFGAAAGLGLITKYTFVWFPVALIAAGLTLREGRRRVLDWRTALAAVVCLAIVAPHLVWLRDHLDTIRKILGEKTSRGELADAGYFARVRRGLWDATNSAVLIALPVAVVVKLFFPKATPRAPEPDRELFRTVLGRFFVAVVVIVLLQILVLGAGRFHERWLQPFAVVFPLWLFSRLDPAAMKPNRVKAFVGLLVFFAAGYTAARAVQVGWFVDKPRGAYPMRMDFAELARQIRAEAGDAPAVLTPEREIGGNLLLHLPGARVACTSSPAYPVDLGDGPVVIAWNPAVYGEPPPWILIDPDNNRWPTWPAVPPERIRQVEVAPSYLGDLPPWLDQEVRSLLPTDWLPQNKVGQPTMVRFTVVPVTK